MVLAWLLASNGIQVRVLERHRDFEREFRGELVQPSSVKVLDDIGLLPKLLADGAALPHIDRRMFVGLRREVMQATKKLYEQGMLISQPALLNALVDACASLDGFVIDKDRAVVDVVKDAAGKVVGVKDHNGAVVDADVVVVCAGRRTPLRAAVGLAVDSFEHPTDVLWARMSFADAPQLLPTTVDVHMHGKGVVVVLQPTTHQRLQIAYSAPGDLAALKKDPQAFAKVLAPFLPPDLRDVVVKKLTDEGAPAETAILKVAVDRLQKWHAPGVLFLGDAAHTMSPSGGQGLNVAIRDAVVAANEFVAAVNAGKPIDDGVMAAVEAARRGEVEAVQAGQLRAGGMVLKPLPVLHIAFTMIGTLIGLFAKKKPAGDDDVKVRFPVRVPG